MASDNFIQLNFLQLLRQDFLITLFRRSARDGETRSDAPGCRHASLPVVPGPDGRDKYWYRFQKFDGSEEFQCGPDANRYVALDYLLYLLSTRCHSSLNPDQFEEHLDAFDRFIAFRIREHPQGTECLQIRPYYLQKYSKYGFLIDYSFSISPPVQDWREVQRLSLSLDRHFEANRNFYSDRYDKVTRALDRFSSTIFPLRNSHQDIAVDTRLFPVAPKSLEKKEYLCGRKKPNSSQFLGLKSEGPYTPLQAPLPKICFIVPADRRDIANDLYAALRGKTFPTFAGMDTFFRYTIPENVIGVDIEDYSESALRRSIQAARTKSGGAIFIACLIGPFNLDRPSSEHNDLYYRLKHVLLKEGIPSQFVSFSVLSSKNQLKWSIANIGLQLFAKLGGIPWIVKPSHEKCLIVGLGQAHERAEDGTIQKFFSYSVLTESTGLYKDVSVLGSSTDASEYDRSFRQKISDLLTRYLDHYDTVVIHSPFNMRRADMKALTAVLDDLSEKQPPTRLVVMKFNDANKYFGYSTTTNSLVPYESTYIALSSNEFLVWFEGLQYGNPTVRKRYGRPMHVEFIYPSRDGALTAHEMKSFLQDAINLSGANWRGFNAKATPVSVYYAQIIARFYRHFSAIESIPGSEALEFSSVRPWFL